MVESSFTRYNVTLDKLNKRQRHGQRNVFQRAPKSSFLSPTSSYTNYGKRKDKYSVAIPRFFYWVTFALFSIAIFATTETTFNIFFVKKQNREKGVQDKLTIEEENYHDNGSDNLIVSKENNESVLSMEQKWNLKDNTVNESQYSSENGDRTKTKLYPLDAIISDGLTSKKIKREYNDHIGQTDTVLEVINRTDNENNNPRESDVFETNTISKKSSLKKNGSPDTNESKRKYTSIENANATKLNSDSIASNIPNANSKCLKSITELSISEMNPVKGERHMVQPPSDVNGTLSLVCCETTAGSLSIAVHSNWAPLGAARFLKMVKANYFSSQVPLMRCIRNFICQFGISGDPSLNTPPYTTSIQDDTNWLPEGPKYRTNAKGIKRYSRGYMAYAGGGKNSRSQQFIMALGDNERLGGGSPWEVPWGEVVGVYSYLTLDAIYTGYGEKGPKQGRLKKEGASPAIRSEFPYLDYITSCHIVDETTFA